MDLKAHIRQIPDFPKPGILFYDISTLLRHGPAWKAAMARLAGIIAPHKPDLLAGIEGDIQSQRGRYAAAEPALVRNVERMAERFGEHSLFAVDALRRAGDHFQRAGDAARAAALRSRQQRAEGPAT